jgi:DNA modification methylase
MSYEIHTGDCLDVMRTMPDCSVDSIVTDPPYGLSFMGKRWDYDVPSVEIWQECLRVLKPGGHLLAFAGTRTQHRMAVRIEDAGFEIRDMIAWVYGSGFPKSLDVSKAMDKAARAEREVVGEGPYSSRRPRADVKAMHAYSDGVGDYGSSLITAPATEAARQWHGWGTALKPALEPITVARKPLIGTVAENVMQYGTGGVNVDRCRVGDEVLSAHIRGVTRIDTFKGAEGNEMAERTGRWPANFIHDGSDEAVDLLASAARFFYCAKASKRDRDEGLDGMSVWTAAQRTGRGEGSAGITGYAGATGSARNHHPTVKPTDLMRYLCRLVTPPQGTVLDPFMGSGSTGKAAALEGFDFIGIEMSDEYVEIARRRIEHAKLKGTRYAKPAESEKLFQGL